MTSNRNGSTHNSIPMDDTFEMHTALTQRQQALTAEIQSVEQEMSKLETLRHELNEELRDVNRSLSEISARHNNKTNGAATTADLYGGARSNGHIKPSHTDYFGNFVWSGELKRQMKLVFGFDGFRLCQEGVCNASMDNRDVVAVMPTGGGKSLTYQLTALLCSGTTLVISPLISLITDQILHLHEAGIEACMLTGSTSKGDQRSISQRLTEAKPTNKRISAVDGGREQEREIKLVYVTPEKISKSKTFMSILQKMANNGTLARIVIDEAHCVSQLGHDFRPDYKKLSILRQLFPHVPILALSATCPPKVLKDLLTVLRMDPVVDGNNAPPKGTVYFSSPLYRKNLHYTVLPKPAVASAAIGLMAKYILDRHKDKTGIIYCLSKKDAEAVASGVKEASNGYIRTGVYHADIGDGEKERLHKLWRNGDVKVVCATIAFGLGIDKGDVRFVLHHSMSKSLDGFYQESGRAGRDGKDSDCVLYYRDQDASRLSSMVCTELDGQTKLYDMLRFAQELQECRKIQFAQYFSASSSLAMSAWSTDGSDQLSRCGHCDNCKRSPDSIERKDVTLESWKVIKAAQFIASEGGRTTVSQLADLVRGSGGGAFGVGGSGKGRSKGSEKTSLNMDVIAGGKVDMAKEDVESLLVGLLLSNYLKEDFSSTAYTINVYLVSGKQAFRLSRLSEEDIRLGNGPRIMHSFLKQETRKKSMPGINGKNSKISINFVPPTRKGKGTTTSDGKGQNTGKSKLRDDSDDSEASEPNVSNWLVRKQSNGKIGTIAAVPDHAPSAHQPRGPPRTISKRKRVVSSEESDAEKGGLDDGNDLQGFIAADDTEDDNEATEVFRDYQEVVAESGSEEEDEGWSYSFGTKSKSKETIPSPKDPVPATKRLKVTHNRSFNTSDIIELSD